MFSLQRFEHFDVSSMVDVSTGHVKVLFAITMKKKITLTVFTSISVKASQKITGVRKRKANCATIT